MNLNKKIKWWIKILLEEQLRLNQRIKYKVRLDMLGLGIIWPHLKIASRIAELLLRNEDHDDCVYYSMNIFYNPILYHI